jgi:hypothetical protein
MQLVAYPLAQALVHRLGRQQAVLTPSRRDGVHARFHIGRVLMVVRARPAPSSPFRVAVAVQSYVGGRESVEVRARRELEGLAWVVGLRREVDLGDLGFAGTFGVTGDPAAARVVLDASARDALLAMRSLAPVLTLRTGVLELSWSFAWEDVHDALLPPPALAVVAAGSARLRPPWPQTPGPPFGWGYAPPGAPCTLRSHR